MSCQQNSSEFHLAHVSRFNQVIKIVFVIPSGKHVAFDRVKTLTQRGVRSNVTLKTQCHRPRICNLDPFRGKFGVQTKSKQNKEKAHGPGLGGGGVHLGPILVISSNSIENATTL